MNNAFFDVCFNIIIQNTQYPDVAGTAKDITDGINYAQLYSQNLTEYIKKHDEIVQFIIKVRDNNIIDSYRDDKNYLLFVPVKSGKPLAQSSPQELYNNLVNEIDRLMIKGIYQVIKHVHTEVNDTDLLEQLLSQDISVLRKYGLIL
ncbi:MAG: hypothetical protein IK108_10150 [Clostridia bacterium]|nr:hypothetical protein [Clostridia bacterium]